ncbi:hypothetical protein C5167_028072 [Papaver somniferum]|nr:hypothetical protein C5167_028072 [Papaver somniferum]
MIGFVEVLFHLASLLTNLRGRFWLQKRYFTVGWRELCGNPGITEILYLSGEDYYNCKYREVRQYIGYLSSVIIMGLQETEMGSHLPNDY